MATREAIEKFYEKMMETIEEAEKTTFSERRIYPRTRTRMRTN